MPSRGAGETKRSTESQDVHVAARKGNVAAVRRLVERTGCVDQTSAESGKTPLHVACQFGQTNVAKILLELGADIEARTGHGRTPLHLAAAQGQEEVVRLLLSKNADKTAKTPSGETAAELAMKYKYSKVERVLKQ